MRRAYGITLVPLTLMVLGCADPLAPDAVVGFWRLVEVNGTALPGRPTLETATWPTNANFDDGEMVHFESDGTCDWIQTNGYVLDMGTWEIIDPEANSIRVVWGPWFTFSRDHPLQGTVKGNRLTVTDEYANVWVWERQQE